MSDPGEPREVPPAPKLPEILGGERPDASS
jgi:hypothetical protein